MHGSPTALDDDSGSRTRYCRSMRDDVGPRFTVIHHGSRLYCYSAAGRTRETASEAKFALALDLHIPTGDDL
jgi:hypothetical protein